MKLEILYIPDGHFLYFFDGINAVTCSEWFLKSDSREFIYTKEGLEHFIEYLLTTSKNDSTAWFELNNINFPMVKEDFEIVEV